MVQERCLWPECEERGILAESGLQNAIYCHDLETPGVWYRGALRTVEVPAEGLWMALNGPDSKNGDSGNLEKALDCREDMTTLRTLQDRFDAEFRRNEVHL